MPTMDLSPGPAERLRALGLREGEKDPAFAEAADLAAAICGAPIAAVTLFHHDSLHVLGAFGSELAEIPREFALCEVTVRDRRLLVVPDLGTDPRFQDHAARTFGVAAYIGAPVFDGDGDAVGTLCVLDFRARPFSTLQVQAVMTLAHQVTAVLTLRQRTQQLALTSELLAAAVEQSPVGMATITQSGPSAGLITGANPAFCALVGRSAQEISQLGCHDITHRDDIAADEQLLADLFSGRIQSGRLVKRYVRPDRSVVWAELTGTVVHDRDGAVDRLLFHALDVTDRRAREAELVSRALQDPLTGLPNRTHLIERLSSLPSGRDTVLVYLDLDGFKPVNDRLGHGVGDQVLVRLAERMRGALRSGDLLCRVGGDEFVAVLSADLAHARATTQRVLDVLAEPVVLGGERICVGASAGLAAVEGDWEAALEAADAAMYRAKRSDLGFAEAPAV